MLLLLKVAYVCHILRYLYCLYYLYCLFYLKYLLVLSSTHSPFKKDDQSVKRVSIRILIILFEWKMSVL